MEDEPGSAIAHITAIPSATSDGWLSSAVQMVAGDAAMGIQRNSACGWIGKG